MARILLIEWIFFLYKICSWTEPINSTHMDHQNMSPEAESNV